MEIWNLISNLLCLCGLNVRRWLLLQLLLIGIVSNSSCSHNNVGHQRNSSERNDGRLFNLGHKMPVNNIIILVMISAAYNKEIIIRRRGILVINRGGSEFDCHVWHLKFIFCLISEFYCADPWPHRQNYRLGIPMHGQYSDGRTVNYSVDVV